jgi:hypothetical protein
MYLFRKFHLQSLRSPKMRNLLLVNEQFLGRRNAVNGTLWTDTIISFPATSGKSNSRDRNSG